MTGVSHLLRIDISAHSGHVAMLHAKRSRCKRHKTSIDVISANIDLFPEEKLKFVNLLKALLALLSSVHTIKEGNPTFSS